MHLPCREILLVDDDPDLVSGLSRILESRGWHVRWALSGHEAVKMAFQQMPEVILMDIMMPGMNGIEACREIRRVCHGVPVIFMTGFSVLEPGAREAGALAVLSKPVDFVKLFATLETLQYIGEGPRRAS
jgi:CheY-like chemotaxis protein